MKKTSFLSALIFLSFLNAVVASTVEAETYFNRIDISSSGKLTLIKGAVPGVKVISAVGFSSDELRVKDSTLIIDGSISGEWLVTLPELKRLEVSGNGSIISDSIFEGSQLDILISGNGKVTLPVKYSHVNVKISGLGKVTLTGSADSVNFKISGSGKIDAGELVVNICNASISGVGKCTVDVRDELITDISGSGKVDYISEPKRVETKITGIGKVNGTGAVVVDLSSDTTSINIGNIDLFVVERKEPQSSKPKKISPTFPLMEIGLNPFRERAFELGRSAPQLLTEKSVSVALNVFQQSWELGNSNIWLTTRLGFTWNNYRWAGGNIQVVKGDSTVSFNYLSDNRNYIKSKLTACYLTSPVMINFMTSRNPKNCWTIGVGGMLGMRLGSHSKMVYQEGGQSVKDKARSDFFLNPFRYGARCSIGYRDFSIFADYYFSELFKPGAGPELTPLNFGVSLVGFRL